MSYETIDYRVHDRIATITLNRPDRLNAFNHQMQTELLAAFDAIDADDEVRAVIVTGAGRGFCAGADLAAGGDTFDAAARGRDPDVVNRDGGGLVSLRIFALTKPIIAAINGPAVGVGITMTLPMDVRLAAHSARIGFVFTRRGLAPEACSSWFLPRLVGISQAARWCYSGRVFDAAEAADGGLVELVADDQLLARANEIASEIATCAAPVSVAVTRQLLWRGLTFGHPMDSHRADSRAIQGLGQLADAKEGVRSFLDKRDPSWTLLPSRDQPEVFPLYEPPQFS
jgi:enoyl-CoA hydratase/carnithine racemase